MHPQFSMLDVYEELNRAQFGPPERLIELSQEALRLSREADDPDNIIRSLTSLAYGEQVTGKYELAFEHAMEALQSTTQNETVKSQAMLRFASLLSDLGADNVALLALRVIEKKWHEGMDPAVLMRAYVSMSTCYLRQQQPEQALPKLGLALQIANEIGDEQMMYWCIHSTGIAYLKREHYEEAIQKFQIVRGYYGETGQFYNLTAIDMLLGEAFLHVNADRAKYFLDAALERALTNKFELLTTQIYINLADYYREKGDENEASASLDKAVKMLKSLGHETKSTALLKKALSRHYEQLGKYKEALKYALA